jgi:hypothetical protein
MPQTFSDDKNVYSVDMMFAYINLFSPKHILLNVIDLSHNLSFKGWGDKKISYAPNEVLENPGKFKEEIKRIHNAELKYPIIVTSSGFIVDGVHRLCKSILSNRNKIKAFVFDKSIMTKFVVNKKRDWKAVDEMKIHEFIELFVKRFNLI